MKTLVTHLVKHHLKEITKRSLINCHCYGLHSVMLLECPEKTIRLYIADRNNELWKNYRSGPDKMSIGFHPHHCALTLHCVKGELFNWEVEESADGFAVDKYKYQSQITDGEMGFALIGASKLRTSAQTYIAEGQSISMPASAIHTVACLKGEITAWLVYEGGEDLNYESVCYSNADLLNQDKTMLYLKPTEQQVLNLLTIAGL